MKPITVSTVVDRPREEVYEYLDVLANHEAFTDHFLTDWTVSGPASGVGAKVRVKAKAPERTVENATSAGGKRRTCGTYTLSELPGNRTLVEFEFGYLSAPAFERPALPLMRPWLRRANEKAMERLAEQLAPVGSAA